MTIFHVLEVLRSRYPIVVVTVVVVVAAAFAVSLKLPKLYTATAALLVDVPEAVAQEEYRFAPTEPSRAYMSTQLDIITSSRVASRVVERLDLVNDPYFVERDAGEAPETDVERGIRKALSRGLWTQPSTEGHVIGISFTASDAEVAARLANGFVEAYLELSLEMSVEPARRQADWYGEQRQDIRHWVEEAQTSLSKYQQEQGILTTDERQDTENAKLQELSNNVVEAQIAASEAAALAEVFNEQIRRGGNFTSLPESVASSLYRELEAELSAQDAEIAELSETLAPRHPRLTKAHGERASIENRMRMEVEKIRETLSRKAEIARARLATLTRELEAQRARVLEINRVRDKIPTLQREVQNAEQAYQLALEQFSVNTLQSRLQNVSATVLHYAEPPLQHSSPDLRKNVAAAGFAGSFLGLLIVVLVEWINPKVRSEKTLEILQIPYLGRVEAR